MSGAYFPVATGCSFAGTWLHAVTRSVYILPQSWEPTFPAAAFEGLPASPPDRATTKTIGKRIVAHRPRQDMSCGPWASSSCASIFAFRRNTATFTIPERRRRMSFALGVRPQLRQHRGPLGPELSVKMLGNQPGAVSGNVVTHRSNATLMDSSGTSSTPHSHAAFRMRRDHCNVTFDDDNKMSNIPARQWKPLHQLP